MARRWSRRDPAVVGQSRRFRLGIRLFLGVLAVALATSAATASGPRVAFVQTPERVVQGNVITVTVAAPSGATCSLSVVYANGSREHGLRPARVAGGRASWTWKVGLKRRAGPARMTAACGRAGHAVQTLIVVGQLVPPRISVVKDGFSVRPHDYGSGADVSYGVILRNTSPNADAINVNVLVNFVMANSKLLGSQSTNIPLLRAGSTYALGTSMTFPGAAPVTRLEVVVQVADKQASSTHLPAIANVVMEPDQSKPQFLADVAGEVVNTDPRLTLLNAQLSAVVFDKDGNVIGGGNGGLFFQLPSGTRAVFKLTSGFNPILTSKAASVLVSAVPTWKKPGS
jgi:hypothetical protein